MPDPESAQRIRVRADLERRLEDIQVLPAVAARIASLDPSAAEFSSQVEDLARLAHRGVGWSDADTPYQAGALAAELRRIAEDCRRLAVLLGLAAPEQVPGGAGPQSRR
jgi:hypothetical protein